MTSRPLPRLRRFGRAALLASSTLVLITCAEDPIGPATGEARLRLVPVYANVLAPPLVIDAVHVRVARPDTLAEQLVTIYDDTVGFSPDRSTLTLRDVTFRMSEPSEDVLVSLELLAGNTVLFAGSQTVTVVRGTVTQPPALVLGYVGPGANVASLVIGPRDTTIAPGSAIDMRLDAFDSSGAAVAQYYASWSLTGGPAAGARINAAGRLTAPTVPDTFFVKAVNVPTGSADSTRVTVGTSVPATALVWTGAVSTDWSAAGNWTPAQVPGPLDSVVIGAAASGRQPTLSTTSLAGALSIVTGGNLTIGGQGLGVARGFSTGGSGVLTMTNDADVLSITGDAVFDGGSELGLLSAGGITLGGNLTQRATSSGDSFHPSGTQITVFSGANPTISFATPGLVPGTSHFQELGWAGTGTLTLATPVLAHGDLVILTQGSSIIASSNGSRLTAAEVVSVGPVTFNNVPLTLEQGAPGALTLANATFSNMPTGVSQLVVSHPGGSFTFSDLVFTTPPVGPNGFYLDVTDPTGAADGGLTIDLVNPTPATPGNFVRTSGGAVVNWPAGSSTVRTWTGAVSTDWSLPGNWSPAQVPDNTSDVVVPVTGNAPSVTSTCAAHTLQVNVLATLNLGTFDCVVGGNTLASGTITGTTGTVQVTAPAQVLGRFPNLLVTSTALVTGTMVLSGNLTVSGATADLVLGGNRVNVSGNLATQNGGVLTMTDPRDTVDLLGNATFAGGSTTGKLTAGALVINRSFTQSGSPTSFAAGGSHVVKFVSNFTRTITFSDPVNSQFQGLDLGANLANFNLASNVRVLGQLVSKPPGTLPPTVSTPGAAGSVTLTAGGADVTLLTIDKVRLVLSGGTIGAFSNVVFQNQLATAIQLTVNNAGQAAQFTFDRLTFLTAPTGGGLYLSANDLDGPTPDRLVINLSNPTPATSTLVQGTNGAVVTWGAALKTWIGPAGGDWFSAANWSPAGVPAATDNAVIPVSATASVSVCPQGAQVRDLTLQNSSLITGACGLTINGNVSNSGTIQGSVVTLAGTGTVNGFFTGPVTVTGTRALSQQMTVQNTLVIQGGTLTLAGHGLIPNDLDVGGTGGSGRIVMTNANDTLIAVNSATFRGSDETGFLTAGRLFLNGSFLQSGPTPSSFVATGTHLVITQAATTTLAFTNPGPSSFRSLQFRSGASTNLSSTIPVTGTLITASPDNPVVQGTGSLLVTGNLAVASGMVLTGVPLTFSPAAAVTPVFDNVRFTGFSTAATQFTINATSGTYTFNSLRFDTQPTTGFYLSANGAVTVNLAGPTPASGGSFVQQLNGATVVWPAASTLTWNGSVDNNWFQAANWSPGFVPSITTDVVIPASTPFTPQVPGNGSARSLTVNTGTSLNLLAGIAVAGNVFADGPVTGGPVTITAPAQLRGTVATVTATGASIIVTGRTVVSGDFFVNNPTGSLALSSQTLQVGGKLVIQGGAGFNMVNPLDSVIVTGEAFFGGSSTVGKLTAGVLVARGDFTQSASTSTTSFAPSGSHKTVLGGVVATNVLMGSPGAGAAGSHFHVLDVTPATGGVNLDVNMQADSLISTTAAAKISSPGVTLTVRRAQVTGLSFNNTSLTLDEQGLASAESLTNVSFAGFPDGGTTMLRVLGPGNNFAARPPVNVSNMNFQGLSIGAANFYVDHTSVNNQAFTLTMTASNQSPQAIPPGNGPALTRVTGTGAVVNWP